MESFLIAIGVTSFVLGAAMILFAWNVVRQNRRREMARAELLSGLAFPEGVPQHVPAELDRPFRRPVADGRDEQPGSLQIVDVGRNQPAIDEFPSERTREVLAGTSTLLRPEQTVETVTRDETETERLFREPEKSGAASRRSIALAAVFIVMTILVGTYRWISRPPVLTRPAVTTSVEAEVPAPAARQESRIELLALDQRNTPAGFIVTGRLRNPAGGAALQNVIAVVDVLDRNGRVLTTASAPIKQAVLGAGEATDFVVAAADAPNVARYRVEFYAKGGEPIPQVDLRRQQVSSRSE
ncbi:MAG: hypothetical protein ACM4AI_23965 [Acidobacteriota bacterium]